MHTQPIILFDDVCVLCNRLVRFVVRVDKQKTFFFAPLDARVAREYLSGRAVGLDSIVLVMDGKVLVRSEAIFGILAKLGWPWKLLLAFRLAPQPVTDGLYDFIARNRYRWFGRYRDCPVPSSEIRERILP